MVSSGFVAGEALMGLVLAALVAANVRLTDGAVVSSGMSYLIGAAVMIFLAVFMVNRSLSATHDPLPVGPDDGGPNSDKDQGAYRDNMDAAKSRVEAAERNLQDAKSKLGELERRKQGEDKKK